MTFCLCCFFASLDLLDPVLVVISVPFWWLCGLLGSFLVQKLMPNWSKFGPIMVGSRSQGWEPLRIVAILHMLAIVPLCRIHTIYKGSWRWLPLV